MSRLTEYEKWKKDGELQNKLILAEGWKREGLTDVQIANNLGISEAVFYVYKNKYKEFQEAIKKGKEIVDFEVENALYKNAIEGNVTAQIFWLKNRKKEQWREKQDYDNDEEMQKLDKLLEEQKNAYMDD